MNSAGDWVGKVDIEMRPLLTDLQKIYLHNLLLQVQADAFCHAAGLADEALRCVDVKGPGLLLRERARRIWPGAAAEVAAPEACPSCETKQPATEVPGSDQGA